MAVWQSLCITLYFQYALRTLQIAAFMTYTISLYRTMYRNRLHFICFLLDGIFRIGLVIQFLYEYIVAICERTILFESIRMEWCEWFMSRCDCIKILFVECSLECINPLKIAHANATIVWPFLCIPRIGWFNTSFTFLHRRKMVFESKIIELRTQTMTVVWK